MRIGITGATGLLGSNFLYEVIKENYNNLNDLHIVLFGRESKDESFITRIYNLFFDEKREYLTIEKQYINAVKSFLQNNVKYIDCDFTHKDLKINSENKKWLKSIEIDCFYHIGALTDLRLTKITSENVNEVNVIGTTHLMELAIQLNIAEFAYVGTAYASGKKTGIIPADYININESFNNGYEISKLKGEIVAREFCEKNKIKAKFFRPSVICGRLIDGNFGAVNKFDVFYQYCLFFLWLKYNNGCNINELYSREMNFDIRMYYNLNGGLNIVPVDYIAKIMYWAYILDAPFQSYNLVNKTDTKNQFYIKQMLDFLSITGIKNTNKKPEKLSKTEKMYYKHCGDIFEPYLTYENKKFDLKSIEWVGNKKNITCPELNKNNFNILLDYGKKYQFGLKI